MLVVAFRVNRCRHLIVKCRYKYNCQHYRESSSIEKSGPQQSPLPPVTGQQSWSQADLRQITKPRMDEPFAKNLFLGRFDKKILVYPEIDSDEELAELNQMVQPLEKFFKEIIDSKAIDANAKIPDKTLQQLKDLGLFGQQIPVEYGGLGLSATKFARIAEVTALDGAVAVTLAAHQSIGLKGLLLFGTEQQKKKYLPKLASGEHIAAFALTESSSGSDAASIQTKATLSEDGSTYYLNGSKIFISNGGIADMFTVFAKTEATDEHGEKHGKVTAFFVEREFGGVTNTPPEDKLGIRGSNTCGLFFDNTPVPAENVIGEVGGGFKVAMNILNSGRFSMGSSGAGILKVIIEQTVEHAITRSQFGQKLTDFGLIQSKFANMAMITYAMESMAYMTAGIIDDYEDPDLSIEAAMVKVFSSEAVWYCVSEALQILGGMGYMKDQPYERYLRDARIMMIFEGTNEILRLLIALSGIQHAGKELKETVKKLKQPLNNPGMVINVIVKRITGKLASPPLTLELDANVHPSFKKPVQLLEKSVLRFQMCVEKLLVDFGNKIVNEQMALEKVANIAIDLYAMTACISRASRSYCIGLRNADHEMLLAKLFCDEANDRIEQNMKLLSNAERFEMYKEVAETVFQNKGYAAEHPLTKNW